MTTENILIILHKKRYWLITAFVIAFIISYRIATHYNNYYKAEVLFLLSDMQIADLTDGKKGMNALIKYNSLNAEKFIRVLYSDNLIKSVDQRLKLGQHYGFNENDQDYFWKLSSKFSQRVSIDKNELNIITLIVKDKEGPEYAANLAELIVNQLVAFNRSITEDFLNDKLLFTKEVSRELNTKYTSRMNQITFLLNQMQNNHHLKYEDYLDMKYQIIGLANQLSLMTDNIEETTQNYIAAQNMLNDKRLDKIFVLNKRYLLPETNRKFINLGIATIASLLFLCVIIVLIHFVSANKTYIRLLLFGKA
jgi:hypothetical protein